MLYVPWVGQRHSIFCGEVNASGPAYLCNPEGPLPAGGKFVEPSSAQDPSEDEVASPELPPYCARTVGDSAGAPGCSVHFGLLLAIFVRQRRPHRHAAAAPAWIRQRPGLVVSPGEFLGEGMLQPRRPGRMESHRWLGWVCSGCPIVHTEARQPIWHHASSSCCRCGS